MKKIRLLSNSSNLLIGLTVLIFLILNSACEKASINYEEPIKKLNAEEFKFIGEQHNKGLTYVFEKLNAKMKENREVLMLNSKLNIELNQLIYDEAEIATSEYVLQYAEMYDDPTSDIAIQIISTVFDGAPLVAPTGEIYSQYFQDSLSLNEKYYLNNLNTIMSDSDYDLNSLIYRIENLETMVYSQTLTEEEQFTIYSATSVAKSTLQYWHDNYDNWSSLLEINKGINQFSWKEVGRSDVAGAAWGASACGVARFFGPIGWKAWAIGVVGSAVGGSAYNAVDQLLR